MALTLTESATELMGRFIEHLRMQGVRSFKGDVLDDAGKVAWTIDVTFEREPKRKGDE